MTEEADDPFAHTRMTLGEHLDELRRRLVRGLVAMVVLFVAGFAFTDRITAVILRPYVQIVPEVNDVYREQADAVVALHPEKRAQYFDPDGTFRHAISERLMFLSPTEIFWFELKVCGYFALFVGSPFLLWQLWAFVAAGLYPKERRWVRGFFPPALLLFLAGVLFSYFLLVPYGLYFLMSAAPIDQVMPALRVGDYFPFVATLCLGMGLVFQLPLLMTFLGTVGMVEAASFARMRRYFVIVSFVCSAILTPGPDIFSQVAMAIPMLLLFEVGIVGARIGGRRRGLALAPRGAPQGGGS